MNAAIQVKAIESETWDPALAEQWDRCVPAGHLGLGRRFLGCCRELQIDGFRLLPLLLTDPAGRASGVACSYYNLIDASDLGNSAFQRAVLLARKLLPNLLRYRVLELGFPSMVGFPAHAGGVRGDVIETLATWAMAQAKRNRDSLVVVRDIDERSAPKAAATLRRLGFLPTPVPATFVVPLPFRSFDDYKAEMRSKYRSRLVNHLKATASLRCEVVRHFAPLAPELLALWRNIYDRATRYRRLVLTRRFLEAVSELDESRVILLRRPDDSVAAFGLVYLDGPMLRFASTGFTREAARDEGVYFRMLYEVIRFAIENGCGAVSLGQSTAEPKMSVGGLPVTLQAWIWHRSGLKRGLLSWLTRTLMRPPPPTAARSVFRAPIPMYPDPELAEDGLSAVAGP
jgi:hypothetical protein